MAFKNNLINLKREEIISVLNSIYAIACDKIINIDNSNNDVRELVKPYVIASTEARVYLIEHLIYALEELAADDDIKSLANNIGKYITDIFYREPLKKFNEDNLENRLCDLDEMSEKTNDHLEIKLFELIRNLNQYTSDDAFNINSYPAIVIGLAKTYEGLNDINRREFLAILNEHYDNKHDTIMDDDVLDEQLSSLSDEESMILAMAIRNYLMDENDTDLTEKVAGLYAYFKELPYNYKRIFLFIFGCAKKEDSELSGYLAELNFIFQKKHIMMIFAELNSMPTDVQKEFYDNIYIDIAPRYEYFLEKKGITRK